jgi:hypothetical protein
MKYILFRWVIMWSELLEGLVGVLSFGFIRLSIYKFTAMNLAREYHGTYKFVRGR